MAHWGGCGWRWDPGVCGALGGLRTLRAMWRLGAVCRCATFIARFSARDLNLSSRLWECEYFSRNSSWCVCAAAHHFLFVGCAPLWALRHSKSLHASSISTGPVGTQLRADHWNVLFDWPWAHKEGFGQRPKWHASFSGSLVSNWGALGLAGNLGCHSWATVLYLRAFLQCKVERWRNPRPAHHAAEYTYFSCRSPPPSWH